MMPTDNEGNDNLYISDMNDNDRSLNTLLRKTSPKDIKEEQPLSSFAPKQPEENKKDFRPGHRPDLAVQYTPLMKSRKESRNRQSPNIQYTPMNKYSKDSRNS